MSNERPSIEIAARDIEKIKDSIVAYMSELNDTAAQQELKRQYDAIEETKASIVENLLFVMSLLAFVVSLLAIAVGIVLAFVFTLDLLLVCLSVCACSFIVACASVAVYFYIRNKRFNNIYDEYYRLFADAGLQLVQQRLDENKRDWGDAQERLFGKPDGTTSSAKAADTTATAKPKNASSAKAADTTATAEPKKGVNLRKFDIVLQKGDDGEVYPIRVYHR